MTLCLENMLGPLVGVIGSSYVVSCDALGFVLSHYLFRRILEATMKPRRRFVRDGVESTFVLLSVRGRRILLF
jgi:hypothetical protein